MPLAALARWMDMAGAALTLGVIAFAVTVWRPGAAQGLAARDRQFARLLWAGWAIYGVGLLLGFTVEPDANISDWVRLARGGVWILFGSGLYLMAEQPERWRILALPALGLAVLPSFAGHAYDAGSADALINDMLHRIAAALWIGGLAGWTGALRAEGLSHIKAAGKAVSRFSNLARFYVLLLAAGGLFAAIQYIPSGEALFETEYGRALTLKGVLFGSMFALAGFNLLFAERRLKSGQARWMKVLKLTIAAELALGMALMLMSAVMAVSVPARDVMTAGQMDRQAVFEQAEKGASEATADSATAPTAPANE